MLSGVHIPRTAGYIIGIGVIILYLVLTLIIPRDGFWTIDNGLKYLAIHEQVPHPLQSLNITIHDSQIDPWNEAAPLIPPFVHRQHDRLIPVFPPLFIALCALCWKVAGSWILSWIPWLAGVVTLGILWFGYRHGREAPNLNYVILLGLASPLAFYSLTLWEHSMSLLFLAMGIALTIHYAPSSLGRWFLGGLLLGIAGMFRLEGWIIATAWIIVSFHYQHRVRWTALVLGVILASFLWIASNFLWTGSFIPLQFSENVMVYGTSGGHFSIVEWGASRLQTLVNLLITAHRQSDVTIMLSASVVIAIILMMTGRKSLFSSVGLIVIAAAYLVFLFFEYSANLPINATAFSGGLMWCCPWVVLACFTSKKDKLSNRILLAALIATVIIIAVTPISRGVHFGPRILLGVIFLLVLLVSRILTQITLSKFQTVFVWIIVILTIVHQGRGIDLLARQKSQNVDFVTKVSQLKERIILTNMWWLPSDLARTWDTHSFFCVSRQDVVQNLLLYMKLSGVNRFAYCYESNQSLANTGFPIWIEERLTWDVAERGPTYVERVRLTEDSLAWSKLATVVGLRLYKPETMERALDPLQAAVDWNPDDPDGWYRLGMLKMQVWDEDGAREAFETAVGIDSTHQRSLKALRRWRNER
ncbi:hypothetical protein AMJ86_08100 [bacterium SM23_57]|nr:MAG: hypothetical protein AMJ86_08100 [bacterium SM23_57]